MNTTRKITDQITYVAIERNGVTRVHYKTMPTNTRLSLVAWDYAKNPPARRISYASYCRLHRLMQDHFVEQRGTTMTWRSIKYDAMTIVMNKLTASDLWEGAL